MAGVEENNTQIVDDYKTLAPLSKKEKKEKKKKRNETIKIQKGKRLA